MTSEEAKQHLERVKKLPDDTPNKNLIVRQWLSEYHACKAAEQSTRNFNNRMK